MFTAGGHTFKPTTETDDFYVVEHVFIPVRGARIASQYPEVTYARDGGIVERPAYIMSDGSLRFAD